MDAAFPLHQLLGRLGHHGADVPRQEGASFGEDGESQLVAAPGQFREFLAEGGDVGLVEVLVVGVEDVGLGFYLEVLLYQLPDPVYGEGSLLEVVQLVEAVFNCPVGNLESCKSNNFF